MQRYRVGYSQGTFDLFHVGHLNLLERARDHCETLIVGVNSDKLVTQYKGKHTIISEEDRCRIVGALKCVDRACIVDTLDKLCIRQQMPFDAIFIGDDWKGNSRWIETEHLLYPYGVDVVYLPYTKDISSTIVRLRIAEK